MRSMASGAAFHCAFLHATQQAFLEAHELAFAFFSGVFRKLRYDNLKAAVKKILRGQRRGRDGAVHRIPVALAI
jgi:transposase